MVLYYILSFLVIFISLFVFHNHIIIGSGSWVAIILVLVSILQSFVFKSFTKNEEVHLVNNTAFSLYEMDLKLYQIGMKWHYRFKLIIVPILCIFILYFEDLWKILLSIIIYILSYIPVRLIVKIENNHEKKNRIDR